MTYLHPPGSVELLKVDEELHDLCKSALLADLELEDGFMQLVLREFLSYELTRFRPGRGRCHKHPEWLKKTFAERNFRVLAALLWEQKPDLVAKMPQLAQLVGLELGTAWEAHYILAELYSAAPWTDSDKSLQYGLAASASGHPLALAMLEPKLMPKLRTLLWSDASTPSMEHLQGLWLKVREEYLKGSKRIARAADASRVVGFLLELVERMEADPAKRGKWFREMAQVAQTFEEEKRFSVLAAVVWEKMPDLLAKMPALTQLLGLDQGTASEAHYLLAELYNTAPWKHPDNHLKHLRAALALGHPKALAMAVPKLTQPLRDLLWSGAFNTCREHIQGWRLGMQDGVQDEEQGPFATAAGLAVSFLLELVERVEAAPALDSFMWWQELQWLQDVPTDGQNLEHLAAMVWQRQPGPFAATWPLAAKRLRLEHGDAHAHLLLAELYSTETFRDLEKAHFYCQQALASSSSQLESTAVVPLLLQIARAARSDASVCEWLLTAVLTLDETNREAHRELKRLHARSRMGF